jgi:phosphohistidine phosphatase
MRRLILLRHAKSDRGILGVPDHSRPLNPRGKEAAARIGAYMAKHHLVPDQVLCSTAQRARDTWEAVEKAFSDHSAATFDKRLYEADANGILAVLQEVKPEAHTVVVVGHNPTLHDLANQLIAAGDIDERANLHQKLPTGALVVIDFAVDGWADVHAHSGRLDRFVTPRSLGPYTA